LESIAQIEKFFEQYFMVESQEINTWDEYPEVNEAELGAAFSFEFSDNEFDLIIYCVNGATGSEADQQSTIAYAYPITFDNNTGRPFAGVFAINLKHHFQVDPEGNFFQYDTIIHELLHILGFNSSLFSRFPKRDDPYAPNVYRPESEVTGSKCFKLYI
jgi:hypothetical protein